jgi:hypothetical protein
VDSRLCAPPGHSVECVLRSISEQETQTAEIDADSRRMCKARRPFHHCANVNRILRAQLLIICPAGVMMGADVYRFMLIGIRHGGSHGEQSRRQSVRNG